MNTKYKILALVPLLSLIGCTKYKHKNVITEIGTINDRKLVVLKDVESGKERVYEFSNFFDQPDFDYLKIDDTITIEFNPMFGMEHYYQNHTMLYQGDIMFRSNADSIHARQQREKLNRIKSEMQPITR